ncbi:MAG TPA: hypothetical protein VK629_22095, partial [Steroidobacteraceae bacterium]|nr:hypothetical protein [Steroidobacteraceae bacterium]
MINRGAVIVLPRKPYLDWAAGLDDSGIVPTDDDEQTVFLIPNYDDDADGWRILKSCWDVIFDEQLLGWHTDESAWPQNRTFAMFREWFDVKFHSV